MFPNKQTNKQTPSKMKQQDKINELLSTGSIITTGNYRSTDIKEIHWSDKTTGRQQTYVAATHVIESGTIKGRKKTRFFVDDSMKDKEINPDTYQAPFDEGQQVVIEVVFAGFVKGRGEGFRGILHAVENDTPTSSPIDKTRKLV